MKSLFPVIRNSIHNSWYSLYIERSCSCFQIFSCFPTQLFILFLVAPSGLNSCGDRQRMTLLAGCPGWRLCRSGPALWQVTMSFRILPLDCRCHKLSSDRHHNQPLESEARRDAKEQRDFSCGESACRCVVRALLGSTQLIGFVLIADRNLHRNHWQCQRGRTGVMLTPKGSLGSSRRGRGQHWDTSLHQRSKFMPYVFYLSSKSQAGLRNVKNSNFHDFTG